MSLADSFVEVIPDTRHFASRLNNDLSRVDTRKAGEHAGSSFSHGFSGKLLHITELWAGTLGIFEAARFVEETFKSSIEQAREAQVAGKVTANVIRTTGGAAHVTAEQVHSLAERLAEKVGIDHNVIQSSENMLLTFKNVRNEAGKGADIFNRTTTTALDMASALGLQLPQATKVLGKALNDPVKGMTALQRVGITFTDAQKKMIKGWVEHGNTIKAQEYILTQLEGRFRGTAEAAATPAAKAKVAWLDFKENLGRQILPTMDRLATWFAGTALPAVTRFGQRAQPVLKSIGNAMGAAFGWIAAHGTEVKAVFVGLATEFTVLKSVEAAKLLFGMGAGFKAFLAGIGPIGWVAIALGAIAGAFYEAYKNSKTFRDTVSGAIDHVRDTMRVAKVIFDAVLAVFEDGFKADKANKGVGGFFKNVGNGIAKAFPVIEGIIKDRATVLWMWIQRETPPALRALGAWGKAMGARLWTWIKDTTPGALKALGAWLVSVGGWFKGTAGPAVGAQTKSLGSRLIGWIGPQVVPTLKALGSWLLAGIKWLAGTGVPWLWKQMQALGAKLVAWVGPRVLPLLKELGALLGSAVAWLLGTGLPRFVVALWKLGSTLLTWVLPRLPGLLLNMVKFTAGLTWWVITKGVPMLVKAFVTFGSSAIRAFIKEFNKTDLGKLGNQLLDQLGKGLTNFGRKVASWATSIKNAIVGAIKKLFGINSPSTVMAGLGVHMIDGLLGALGRGRGAVNAMVHSVFGDPLKAIRNIGSKVSGALGAIFGSGTNMAGTGVQRWAGVVSQALAMLGQSQAWMPTVMARMNQESGGNPLAINTWDINAMHGDPSRGLMQTIGATFSKYAGSLVGRGIYDPLANVFAALNYTLHRYGNLSALARPGGYDTGGFLNPGQLGINLGRHPERVLSAEQTASFDRLVALLEKADLGSLGGGGPRTLVIVDKDGALIGRMRVEAGHVVDEELAAARWGQG
jgi:hypothetical protein